MDTNVDRFAKFDLFADLPSELLEDLANTVNDWSVAAGETLIKHDAESLNLFAIEEGRVEIYDHDERLGEAGSGEIVGEMGLESRSPRTATVKVTEDAKGFLLSNSQVRMAKRRSDDFGERLGRLAESRAG